MSDLSNHNKFMFGQIELTVENVVEILRSAYFLKIPFLIENCLQFIEKNINVSYFVFWRNAIKELELSKSLEIKFSNFIDSHFEEVFIFLSDDELKCKLFSNNLLRQEDVLTFVLKWISYDSLKREYLVDELLSMVRFKDLTPKFIFENIASLTFENYDILRTMHNWLQWHYKSGKIEFRLPNKTSDYMIDQYGDSSDDENSETEFDSDGTASNNSRNEQELSTVPSEETIQEHDHKTIESNTNAKRLPNYKSDSISEQNGESSADENFKTEFDSDGSAYNNSLNEQDKTKVPLKETIQELELFDSNGVFAYKDLPTNHKFFNLTYIKEESCVHELKILAFNCSGLKKKMDDKDFLEFIFEYDIIILLETFLEEKDDKIVEDKFRGYTYELIHATRRNRNGRASGGILCAVKSNLEFINLKLLYEKLVFKISHKQEEYYIIPIYLNSNKWKTDWDELVNFLNIFNEQNVMLLGDLNARIGNYQNPQNLLADYSGVLATTRNSRDINKSNSRGNNLVEMFKKHNFLVLNGSTKKDKKGKLTHITKSVIDYVVVKGTWYNILKDYEVLSKIKFSNHKPLCTTLKLI